MLLKKWKSAMPCFVVAACLFSAVESFAQSLGGQAPGEPIFNCDGDKATISRLLSGLPVQEEAIKSAEAALETAKAAVKEDNAEARKKWTFASVKLLSSQAKSIASSSEILLAKQEALKAAGISAEAASKWKWLESVKKTSDLSHELAEKADNFDKLRKAYKAGSDFGKTVFVQKSARDLSHQIEAVNKLLDDSGIKDQAAEEVGAKLSFAMWGPVGEAGFRGVVTGIDLLVASGQALISSEELGQAERNLEVMRSQYQRVTDRIYELRQEISGSCANKKAETQKASSPTDKTSGGPGLGTLTLIGAGVAGAVGVAAAAQQNQHSTSGIGGCPVLPIACTNSSQCACGGVCAEFGGSGICSPK